MKMKAYNTYFLYQLSPRSYQARSGLRRQQPAFANQCGLLVGLSATKCSYLKTSNTTDRSLLMLQTQGIGLLLVGSSQGACKQRAESGATTRRHGGWPNLSFGRRCNFGRKKGGSYSNKNAHLSLLMLHRATTRYYLHHTPTLGSGPPLHCA